MRERRPSRTRLIVTHREPTLGCNWTMRCGKPCAPETRMKKWPFLNRASVTPGCTATLTAMLRPPRQLAWYAVAIRGRARYVHVPFAPLSTVATERADVTPYGFEKITTCSPAVWVGTVPVS